jgi:hypothetical protein
MFVRHLRALCLPLATAAALGLPLAAQATATSTFYGSGFGSLFDKTYDSFSTTVNGIGLTIQVVSSGSDPKVAVRWDGIGVSSAPLEAGELNSQLFGSGDSLLLSFSQDVRINSIVLSGWDTLLGAAIDQASVTTQGSDFKLTGGVTPFLSPLTTFHTGALLPVGRFYTLDATGSLSAFRLAGLSVTAVPELHSSAMLALGLGGIALLRRRQTR